MLHASLLAAMHAGDALLTHAGAAHLDGEGPIALMEAARSSYPRAVFACIHIHEHMRSPHSLTHDIRELIDAFGHSRRTHTLCCSHARWSRRERWTVCPHTRSSGRRYS